MCTLEVVQNIYSHIMDDKSREIYINRLNFSLTGDEKFLEKIIDRYMRQNTKWMAFIRQLEETAKWNKLVIFGAGIWGKILYKETAQTIGWSQIIDSNASKKIIGKLKVLDFKEYIQHYDNEYIVVSSYKNYSSMFTQLCKAGIPKDRIIDAGQIIYEMTEKAIYFDLEELQPQREKELFVDAGAYDGLTTKEFMNWCHNKGYAYCFEPDDDNIARIKANLQGDVSYEIVPSALWSNSTILTLNARQNFATSVHEIDEENNFEKIKAVSLDDFLENKRVTFIKMDIEGAELEALKGAKRTIITQKPKLAISIYHKREDIWQLPALILEYCPDYRLYLRHYSFSDYDTVLYAV